MNNLYLLLATLIAFCAANASGPIACSVDDVGFARYDGANVYPGKITNVDSSGGSPMYDYLYDDSSTGTSLPANNVFSLIEAGCPKAWKSGHCTAGKYVWVQWSPGSWARGVATGVTATEVTGYYTNGDGDFTLPIEAVQQCDCNDTNCVPCVDHCACGTVWNVPCVVTACMVGDKGFARHGGDNIYPGQITDENEVNDYEYIWADDTTSSNLRTRDMFSTLNDGCPGPWTSGHCVVGQYVWMQYSASSWARAVVTDVTNTTITGDFTDGSGSSGALPIADVEECSCHDGKCIPCADHCSCKDGGLKNRKCWPKCPDLHDTTCNARSGSDWSDQKCRCNCHTEKGNNNECAKQCHWRCSVGCDCVDHDPEACTAKSPPPPKHPFSDQRCQRLCNDPDGGCDTRCDRCDGCPCPEIPH